MTNAKLTCGKTNGGHIVLVGNGGGSVRRNASEDLSTIAKHMNKLRILNIVADCILITARERKKPD